MKEYIRILVVDHEPVMRNLLLRILESEGYSVCLIASAAEALEKLAAEKFDIMLADMKMPETTGFELLHAAKAKCPEISFVMMTSYGEACTIKEALMNGADEYITKPFKSSEVSLIIERAYWRLISSRNAGKRHEQIVIDEPMR